MTPAEQLRATMALLEAIAEPASNEQALDRLFATPIDATELDEGMGAKSILATLIAAAGMSLASGASAATPIEDARCAGAMIAFSNIDQARGQNSMVAPAREAAEKLAARAGQGGVVGAEFERQAGAAFKSVKQMVEAGKEDTARDYAVQCIQSLKSGSGEKPVSSAQTTQQKPQQSAPGSYQINSDAEAAARAMLQGNRASRDNIASRYQGDSKAWAEFSANYKQGYQMHQDNGMRQR